MQKHQSRCFQDSQEEQLEVRYLTEKFLKMRRELLGQCQQCRIWQTQPTRVSETKGNLSLAIHVDKSGNGGIDRKELASCES